MVDSHQIENSGSKVSQVLEAAAKLPGVRINRAQYLRAALRRYCTAEQIEQAIAATPSAAGIAPEVIQKVAKTSIKYETGRASGLSTLAGIPAGLAMFGTVPADVAQNMGHMLRIAQKLAYIHSWPDLFDNDDEDLDEATEGILILFVGTMFGVSMAQGAVTKAAGMIAQSVAKQLPKRALTKGVLYPIVKQVAKHLGAKMTKSIFASGVAKAIPVIGAVTSGALTVSTFLPMARRLQCHLASLDLTKPAQRARSDVDLSDVLIQNDGEVEEPLHKQAPQTL